MNLCAKFLKFRGLLLLLEGGSQCLIPFQVFESYLRLSNLVDKVLVLLVAVPIGRLGDHHGRRKIMALALVGVTGSLCEIFTVCMHAISNETGWHRSHSLRGPISVADDGPRCISQNISPAAGLALIGHAITWRRPEFSFCVHVGHGIGIHPTRKKVQWITYLIT
jgi:hypothetical protein